MPKMPTQRQFPFGAVERDLMRLMVERVGAAVRSVQQLTDDKEVKFQLALGAAIATLGTAAGTYKAVYEPENPCEPHEFGEVILKLMRETHANGRRYQD